MSLLAGTRAETVPFAASLTDHGDRVAVVTADSRITYSELADRVESSAAALGDVRRLVMVATDNHVDGLVAYLAALHGGHPVLLVPSHRPAVVERMVAAFDPDVVAGETGSGSALHDRRRGTAHDLHPDLALLLCTSGSTGAPRLVRLSHTNVQSNALAIAEYLGLGPGDRAITSLPMPYCYGLSVINSHLAAGAGIIMSGASVVDPCFWDMFHRHGATNLAGVPHTFDLLDRVGFEEMALPTLRFVTQAGGRLSPDRVRHHAELGERNGWALFVMYGQTEATARMAYLPPPLAPSHPDTVGVPIPGGSFELAPVEGGDDPDEGELVYRGPNVMLGYASEPGDLARGADLEALHTGDLARRTRAGLWQVVGRLNRFAKLFGLRIDLDHIESLLADEGIPALCASDDSRLVVAVTERAQREPALKVVETESGLPPSRVAAVVVPELPRLANGKPDHGAVIAAASHADLEAEPSSASATHADGAVDPAVRAAFVKVLQRPDVSADSTFVDLGGDSLSYVEMSIALEEVLGDLPQDWHTTRVGSLVPADRRPRRLRRTEMTIVLRALATVVVVATHVKLFSLFGGAHILLGVAGYNFTRFQRRASTMVRSVARIAIPSMVWLAFAMTIDDQVNLSHVLLSNGWVAGDAGHGGYWYVEALVQILVPLVVVLSIPSVRRVERAHRFAFPMALLAAGLLLRFQLIDLPTPEPRNIRPFDTFWIFAIGWAAAEARSAPQRLGLSGLVVAAVPGYFGHGQRELLVTAGLLLLIWVPSVGLTRRVHRIVGQVAAASLYTYLVHWQVFPPLLERFGAPTAFVGSLLAGTVGWWVGRHVSALVGSARQRAARSTGVSAPSAPSLETATSAG